jgi:hypothetical protein
MEDTLGHALCVLSFIPGANKNNHLSLLFVSPAVSVLLVISVMYMHHMYMNDPTG